jgi:hypothetical protein
MAFQNVTITVCCHTFLQGTWMAPGPERPRPSAGIDLKFFIMPVKRSIMCVTFARLIQILGGRQNYLFEGSEPGYISYVLYNT